MTEKKCITCQAWDLRRSECQQWCRQEMNDKSRFCTCHPKKKVRWYHKLWKRWKAEIITLGFIAWTIGCVIFWWWALPYMSLIMLQIYP